MAHKVVDEIISDNEWRHREFADFKRNPYSVNPKLWSRMCVPMIYAHWEGFVVDALRTLLRHLNTLQLTGAQLTTNLVVVGLDETYQFLSGKQSFEQRMTFTDKFNEILQKIIKFELKVNTKSNLNDKILKELCDKFGFQYAKFDRLARDIRDLTNQRNAIAHGENAIILDAEKLATLIRVVEEAMSIFLCEIDSFLTNELYLLERSQPA